MKFNWKTGFMVLEEYKVEGDSITLNKQELERLSEHYYKLAKENSDDIARNWLYLGKADVLIDILKMFEPLVG